MTKQHFPGCHKGARLDTGLVPKESTVFSVDRLKHLKHLQILKRVIIGNQHFCVNAELSKIKSTVLHLTYPSH